MNDVISRQAVLNTLENADKFLDEERTVEKYKELLTECIEVLPSEKPEIIQCKDCKWKQGSECVRFAEVRPFPNDFCSRAERSDKE